MNACRREKFSRRCFFVRELLQNANNCVIMLAYYLSEVKNGIYRGVEPISAHAGLFER